MDNKEAYEKIAKVQLKKWRAEMDRLKAKIEQAEAETRVEYYRQLEDLKSKYDHVHQRYKELQGSSDEAWKEIRIGMERAWEEMSHAIKSAAQNFQKQ